MSDAYQERLEKWTALEARLVNARTLTFILAAAGFITLAFVNVPRSWNVLPGIAAVIYFCIARSHRIVDRAIGGIRTRIKLAGIQKARANLDWQHIPAAPAFDQDLPNYFADLNLLSPHGQSLLRLLQVTHSTRGFEKLVQLFTDADPLFEELLRRQRLVGELRTLRVLRHRFHTLAEIQSERMDTRQILSLFEEPLHSRHVAGYVAVIILLQLVTIAAFIPFFFLSAKPLFLIPLVLLYVAYKMGEKELHLGEAFDRSLGLENSLGKFAALSEVLARLSHARFPSVRALLQAYSDGRGPTAEVAKLSRVVGMLGVRQNPVAHLLANVFFPWDLFWTLRLERLRGALQKRIPEWLETLAEFEAFVSLAEFAENFPDATLPVFVRGEEAPFLEAKALGHPLIPAARRVCNDIVLDRTQRCFIITGSNMSGKSTFLRTIGINVLLAKTGTVVFARSLRLQNLKLLTSLRPTDSLEEGASSFYAEVKQLRHILDHVPSEEPSGGPRPQSLHLPSLYLIDEIYKGTNNRERLLGARAYVRELARRLGCGLIATHDLELANLEAAGNSIRNFHFRESFDEGRMTFSYKMTPGPCPTSNALKVIELAGLPVE